MDVIVNNITSLIAFVGARQVITDVHESHKEHLSHPLVKILIIISILYMNIKHVKITILLFFLYIFLFETSFTAQKNPYNPL